MQQSVETGSTESTIVSFDCYSSIPLETRLKSTNVEAKNVVEVIKRDLQVPFGSDRKWKEWYDAIKEFRDKGLESLTEVLGENKTIVLIGQAPQPIFILLGKILGRVYPVYGILNFNAIPQTLECFQTNGKYDENDKLFEVQRFGFNNENTTNMKPEQKKVQLFFAGNIPMVKPKPVDDTVEWIIALVPKKIPIPTNSSQQARTEIGNFLRHNIAFQYEGYDLVVTTSMPNPLNYCLGTVWPDNIVGPLRVYDFINLEYKKVDIDF